MLVVLTLIASASASPPEMDLIPLKSGAFVHLEPPETGRPGRLTFVVPRQEGLTEAWVCPVADPARWRGWAGYFEAIGKEALPTRVVPPEPEACGSTAARGADAASANVVELTVTSPRRAGETFRTTIGRREAEILAVRVAAMAEAPAPGAPAATSNAAAEPGIAAALRLLYLARGWTTRTDDPGWIADLEAARAAAARGDDVASMLHKVWSDKRLRPGALADLAGPP